MSFEDFENTLKDLVASFKRRSAHGSTEAYDEQSLRNDFLNPFWRSLGWDLENKPSLPQSLRDVQIESRVDVAGKAKRADYIFRTDGISRFVCEAKAAGVDLLPRYAFQAQRYAFNLRVLTAVLTNFKTIQIFLVGAKPQLQAPFFRAKEWQFAEYTEKAREIWDLLSRDAVAGNSLERFIASQRKKPAEGRGRQGWLFAPTRIRTVDEAFLEEIETYRAVLARDLVTWNQGFAWDTYSINEAVQRIIDRVLFVRICEDRGIDTGRPLERILADWEEADPVRPRLYQMLVAHFRTLDTAFNGALFREHFSEALAVPDSFLSGIIADLSSEDSPYLFNTLSVDIIGSVYERFIGKTIHIRTGARPRVDVELKPEVRKAGGVYYTPQYIVNYIVEKSLGSLLEGRSPKEIAKIKVLDPSCGSGSFLIRVFERICEHYVRWYSEHPEQQREGNCFIDDSGSVHLTTHLKRQILLDNVFGVDIDAQAVEVSMLSLYLKILEDETRSTLSRQQRLFPRETFLPDLTRNIRLGNSLVGTDFLEGTEENVDNLNAFDWDIQFPEVMRRGKFDAIVGNPPYVTGEFIPDGQIAYLKEKYKSAVGKFDLYMTFLERAIQLRKRTGNVGFIIPNRFMVTRSGRGLRGILAKEPISEIVDFRNSRVFQKVTNYPCILLIQGNANTNTLTYRYCISKPQNEVKRANYKLASLTSAAWTFSDIEEKRLLSRINSGSRSVLGDVIARFSTGVQTGADKILTFTKEDIADKRLEPLYLRPFLRGRDIKRFHIGWRGKWIFWPYSSDTDEIVTLRELRSSAPNLFKIVVANRVKMRERVWFGQSAQELSGRWFGLMYREKDANFQKLHLVTPSLTYSPEFAMNSSGYRFTTGTAGVTGLIPVDVSRDNCFFLLGLLNSPVCAFFMRQTSPEFAGGFLKYTAPYLKQFPLPSFDPEDPEHQRIYKSIWKGARRLTQIASELSLARSDAQRSSRLAMYSGVERIINDGVARLYGLTADEVTAMAAKASPEFSLMDITSSLVEQENLPLLQ